MVMMSKYLSTSLIIKTRNEQKINLIILGNIKQWTSQWNTNI